MVVRCLLAVSAPISAAALAAAVIALGPTSVATLVAERAAERMPSLSPRDAWDTFTADLTIRRHLLAADGATSAEAPTVRYRWTRAQRAGGWKSIVEVSALTAPTVRTPKGPVLLEQPSSVVRIEDDEDGTPLRVFDRRGRPMHLPTVDDRRVLGEPVEGSFRVPALPELAHPRAGRRGERGRDWVDGLVALPDRKAARREALSRRFGRANGRVRNLDRFITGDGTHTIEVLADSSTAVPVEINVARDGLPIAQSTLTYESATDGTLRRRAVRTEQRVSGDTAVGSTALGSTALGSTAARTVTHIELANIRLERRGVQ